MCGEPDNKIPKFSNQELTERLVAAENRQKEIAEVVYGILDKILKLTDNIA